MGQGVKADDVFHSIHRAAIALKEGRSFGSLHRYRHGAGRNRKPEQDVPSSGISDCSAPEFAGSSFRGLSLLLDE